MKDFNLVTYPCIGLLLENTVRRVIKFETLHLTLSILYQILLMASQPIHS